MTTTLTPGEDVSLGLWLSQLDQPSKVRWIHAPWEFSTSKVTLTLTLALALALALALTLT